MPDNKNTKPNKSKKILSDSIYSTLASVLSLYNCKLNNSHITCIGNGLINDTLLVHPNNGDNDEIFLPFILQRINTQVFSDPQTIVNNATLIHQHLQAKIDQQLYPLNSMGHLPNIYQHHLSYVDSSNNKKNKTYWRALNYIPNSYTVEEIKTTIQAELVANAFAQFSLALSDIDTNKLNETLPKFHNINNRLEQLSASLNTNFLGTNASEEKQTKIIKNQTLIDFVNDQKAFISHVNGLTKQLPIRVTHNDTKINNVLFSQLTQKPIAVIDLDTCMPGFLMNDFGDLVRTSCPNIDENSTHLTAMEVRLEIFSAIARGYINTFNESLSHIEKESLVIGVQLIPLMLGIRFLTDYFNDDIYFKTTYAEQNIDRAKNQFHLFSLLQSKHNELLNIVMSI